MQDYTTLVSRHSTRRISHPQRVRRHQESFSYERPRRVRMPSTSQLHGAQSQGSHVRVEALAGIKSLQTIAIFIVLVVMLAILWFTTAQLMGDPMASIPSQLGTVSVHSGDTLSSIAKEATPAADPVAMIEKIQELNQLSGALVYPGQVLVVPMG